MMQEAFFAQRRGCVLEDLAGPLPVVRELGFSTELDKGVETLALPPCEYSVWEEASGPLPGTPRRAVERRDPVRLGRVATASALIMQRPRPGRGMPDILRLAREAGALGVQVAHSGTVAGFLFDPGPLAARRMEQARPGLWRLGLERSRELTTDLSPRPERVP